VKTIDKPSAAMLLGLAALLVAGCIDDSGPQARIQHYLRSDESVMRLNRVVFITLQDPKGTDRIAEDMTGALVRAIQPRGLFHIDVMPATDAACQELPLFSRRAYSMKQLAQIQDALGCEAVMFGSVSQFQTYPRLQIGVFLRLIDLKRGQLVWAVDHIWDTTDKATEERIEHFFGRQMRSGYAPADHELALMSPKVFQKFVAYEVANTLPSSADDEREAGPALSCGNLGPGKSREFVKKIQKELKLPHKPS